MKSTQYNDFAPKYLTMFKPHVPHRIGGIINNSIKNGLRQEELLALQWKHVDFKNNMIKVRQAATVKNKKSALKDPKTFKSNREIPMHSDVVGILKKCMPTGSDISEQYIFGNESGELWLPRNFQRDYKKFFIAANKAKYNIKYRSPHICRHTFASNLRAAGVDIKTISALLGHSKIDITANIYTHTDYESMLNAITKI